MTLEEAMARIKVLEGQNEDLKKFRREWRDAYPGAEILGIYPSTSDFSAFLSFVKARTFGTVVAGKNRNGVSIDRAKKVLEMTNEEYAYYSEFTKKLFTLIKETIDGWKERT